MAESRLNIKPVLPRDDRMILCEAACKLFELSQNEFKGSETEKELAVMSSKLYDLQVRANIET